jgi:hypothetical protein
MKSDIWARVWVQVLLVTAAGVFTIAGWFLLIAAVSSFIGQ